MFRTKHREPLAFGEKIRALVVSALLMAIGILIFKYLPMHIWGPAIEFDASLHVTVAVFVLYIAWYFVDQNPRWHTPFFVFAALVVAIVAAQRLLVDAHNDIGVLAGIVLSLVSIALSRWASVRKKIHF